MRRYARRTSSTEGSSEHLLGRVRDLIRGSGTSIYESPFTDLTPRGPDGLFTSQEVDRLVEAIARIRDTALAA